MIFYFWSPEIKGVWGHGRPESRLFLRNFFHYQIPEGLGGGCLSIESRVFFTNICHFIEANLPFKSDFESNFTFSTFLVETFSEENIMNLSLTFPLMNNLSTD